MYYVGFSTATISASLILFQGFNTTDATNTISLIAGFIVTFMGVHLLNLSRKPEVAPTENGNGYGHARRGSALDSGLTNPRLSVGRSIEVPWSPSLPLYSGGHGRRSSLYRAQNVALHSAFEEDDGAVGLGDLHEEEDEDDDERSRLNPADRRDRTSPLPSHDRLPANGSAR